MRVVLTTWGSRGDIEPLAGLAVRLKELGAEVRFCAAPDEEFVELLAREGIELIPLGPTVKSVVARERPPTADDAFRLAADLVAARFETLGQAAQGSDVMVATGLMPSGARSVADKLGLRYWLAAFHVYGLPSQHYKPGRRPGTPSTADENDLKALWRQDAEAVYRLYGEAENSHRAAIGLPPVENIRDYVFGEPVLLASDPVLCPWAELTDLDLIQTGAWILPDRRPLPAEVTEFLAAGEPPVYVGFGSMAMHSTPGLARIVVDAVRAQGRRVLLAKGWAQLAAIDAQNDCLAVGDISHQALFPQVAAVVHHGGAGTTTAAAMAGVPQVVVPQFADQPLWAGRVAELGIGVAHDGPTPTFDSLSAALKTVLTTETRDRAKEVGSTLRTDGTTVAAKLILES
ncbi:vancomycin aglycone glucosyltransferase [Hamadaea flava]|uniref:Glycosyltransferase n=1 Tax=Hamadaea flava TaxID=1742688 RepID=A0ABV8LP52_9ACTN|nr:glycosyltransferase [Hamadaea flava]MCP2324035.1 vancomycin aglycone glucosyltransferase [Hamadaea flava]